MRLKEIPDIIGEHLKKQRELNKVKRFIISNDFQVELTGFKNNTQKDGDKIIPSYNEDDFQVFERKYPENWKVEIAVDGKPKNTITFINPEKMNE